jgi:hypothetical protein
LESYAQYVDLAIGFSLETHGLFPSDKEKSAILGSGDAEVTGLRARSPVIEVKQTTVARSLLHGEPVLLDALGVTVSAPLHVVAIIANYCK